MAKAILVPHDGSTMSDAASKYALDVAKGMNMKIKLVRIIPGILDFSTMSFWTEVERKRVRKEIRLMKKEARQAEYEKLQKQIALINSNGVEGSAFVAEGADVVEEILERIKKEAVSCGSRQQKAKAKGPLVKNSAFGKRGQKVVRAVAPTSFL